MPGRFIPWFSSFVYENNQFHIQNQVMKQSKPEIAAMNKSQRYQKASMQRAQKTILGKWQNTI